MIHVRHPTAVVFAGVTTFSLLFLMQFLIQTTPAIDRDERSLRLVPFVKVDQVSPLQKRRERPPKPPEPEQRPETELSPADAQTPIAPLFIDWSPPRSLGPTAVGGFPDGDLIALRQVAPAYPQRAVQRGLEGYVIVEFTVTTAGTTDNIVVVESSHSLFHGAAVKAAGKARYRPRIVDGQAVPVHGVRNRFTFQLED